MTGLHLTRTETSHHSSAGLSTTGNMGSSKILPWVQSGLAIPRTPELGLLRCYLAAVPVVQRQVIVTGRETRPKKL